MSGLAPGSWRTASLHQRTDGARRAGGVRDGSAGAEGVRGRRRAGALRLHLRDAPPGSAADRDAAPIVHADLREQGAAFACHGRGVDRARWAFPATLSPCMC
ncbi:hypothetical protein GCM10025783_09660 [Amnibacterium soli]|uniref:Uncharacterized protein n=1 Tax=Amnibacterium soli TaxID=1282736 RepID=A0ABP8YYL8_9MICO